MTSSINVTPIGNTPLLATSSSSYLKTFCSELYEAQAMSRYGDAIRCYTKVAHIFSTYFDDSIALFVLMDLFGTTPPDQMVIQYAQKRGIPESEARTILSSLAQIGKNFMYPFIVNTNNDSTTLTDSKAFTFLYTKDNYKYYIPTSLDPSTFPNVGSDYNNPRQVFTTNLYRYVNTNNAATGWDGKMNEGVYTWTKLTPFTLPTDAIALQSMNALLSNSKAVILFTLSENSNSNYPKLHTSVGMDDNYWNAHSLDMQSFIDHVIAPSIWNPHMVSLMSDLNKAIPLSN
ncbi:MAG: hypothetical protein ACOVOR_02515 [Rhabdochlamydiaceae bacterium]